MKNNFYLVFISLILLLFISCSSNNDNSKVETQYIQENQANEEIVDNQITKETQENLVNDDLISEIDSQLINDEVEIGELI